MTNLKKNDYYFWKKCLSHKMFEQFIKTNMLDNVDGLSHFTVSFGEWWDRWEEYDKKEEEEEEEEEEDDDDDLAKYDKYMEYEFPQRMEDNPTKIRNIIRDYFNGLRSINDLFWDGGQVKEWGDEDLMNYVQDRLIDERWEEEEEKCSTCGKRLNDAELIEDICGPGCDEYDKGLLETREYPTIEEILSKMKELKEDENEWDDDTIYDAICEWDDKFADDPDWFNEEDTDVKDSLRDNVCGHLGLGEYKKEED